jgi:hypothetical protein
MMVWRKPLAQAKPGVKQPLDLSVFENADLWIALVVLENMSGFNSASTRVWCCP